jgi:hypothetical protein
MATSIESYVFACRPPASSIIGRLVRHRENIRGLAGDYINMANAEVAPAEIAALIASNAQQFATLFARLQAIDDDLIRRQRMIDGLPTCQGGQITRAMVVAEVVAVRNAVNNLSAAPLTTAQEIITACNSLLSALPAYDQMDI